jgi:hypothetical protein
MSKVRAIIRRSVGVAVLAAAAGLAAASPASADTGPPANDWLFKVVSPDGGATSYMFHVSGTTYYVVTCDTYPDGHHAEGWIEGSPEPSGPFLAASEHVKALGGNNTCATGEDTPLQTGRYYELYSANYEKGTIQSLNTSSPKMLYIPNP